MKAWRVFLAVMIGIQFASAMPKPAAHTAGTPTGRPTGVMKPGEYWWNGEISPNGPVVALVSIPEQMMHVYRNGILIGRTTVSTGSKGHATPSGVFTILEKKKDHSSKKYGNAPMPNMQRLTWSGIAMHSGNLPGYPASHGCVRMPYDFSVLLFNATARGGTVIIGDDKTRQPRLAAHPGVLLAPKDVTPEMAKPLASGAYEWKPERSTNGPITALASTADRMMYVYRNGEPIGRAALSVRGMGAIGGHVFTLLEGTTAKASWWAPGRQGRRWMQTLSDDSGRGVSFDELGKRLVVNPEFATRLYDELKPGATIIVTDQPAVRRQVPGFTILAN
jgi:lipoprotein-anchoring transpeptidase ErfK/SrfK